MRELAQTSAREQESLEREASHVLEEGRMVLPGVQALFGFQLVAVFNAPFEKLLAPAEQTVHLGSLILSALAIVLLMSPAAYHRQAEPHQISELFLKLSSVLLALGMFMLMLSIQLDCYLIARIILKQRLLAGLLSCGLGSVYLFAWFVLPRVLRSMNRKNRLRSVDAARAK